MTMEPEGIPDVFLTVAQLARRWAISRAAAYRHAGSTLSAMRIGASIRIPSPTF